MREDKEYMLTSERARTIGRIGAHVTHSRYSGEEVTAAARHAFLARFEREVDPDGVLDSEERSRRAEHAKRAYFSRLALARHRK